MIIIFAMLVILNFLLIGIFIYLVLDDFFHNSEIWYKSKRKMKNKFNPPQEMTEEEYQELCRQYRK